MVPEPFYNLTGAGVFPSKTNSLIDLKCQALVDLETSVRTQFGNKKNIIPFT